MRCKNCGSENDDNLYICQNCGSPLYDEDEPSSDDGDKTRVFKVQGKDENLPSPPNDEDDKKKKQTTIIIAVLCVILVAVIAGTVIAIVSSKNKEEETSSLTQVSTTQTTSQTTTQPTTTEKPTETTTETTTQTTTKELKLSVSLSCNDGGEVEGDGDYSLGENVTVVARPDDGYDFDGWYNGSTKVSSKENYTFTITKNTSLNAVFVIVNEEDSDVDVIGDDED